MRIRVALTIVAALVIAVASCRRSQPPVANIAPGSAYGWELDGGKRGQLSDYKGKVVLLDFYATWCEPCRAETPHLVQLHQQFASQGLQIIGLNVGGEDDHAEVPAFAKEFGIQYPLAIPDDQFIDQYMGMNQNIPQSFIIDRQGNIVRRFVGFGEESVPELDRVVQTTLARVQ